MSTVDKAAAQLPRLSLHSPSPNQSNRTLSLAACIHPQGKLRLLASLAARYGHVITLWPIR